MNSRNGAPGWIFLLLLPTACAAGDSSPTNLIPGLGPAPTASANSADGGGTGAPSASSGGSGGSSSGAPSGGSGSSGGGGSGSTSSGGSTSGSADDAGVPVVPPGVTPNAFAGAAAYVSTVGNSPHNPGKACMASGCHSTGGGGGDAPPFLIGGTVYKDYAGTIPAPGVEVRVLGANGTAATTHSGANGNFYIGASSTVTFPAIVGARDGTTTRPMVTALTGTMGACASAGCHIVGGKPASGDYYPIHVP